MSNLAHFWLVSGQVCTVLIGGVEATKNLNTLVVTEGHAFTRMDLAKAQQSMQHLFVEKCKQVPGAKIVDCFIFSINHLGLMSQEEFHAGFPAPAAPEDVKPQELHS